MKRASCRPSGAWNFEMTTGFLANLWMLIVNRQGLHSAGTMQGVATGIIVKIDPASDKKVLAHSGCSPRRTLAVCVFETLRLLTILQGEKKWKYVSTYNTNLSRRGYVLGGLVFEPRYRQDIFLFSKPSRPTLGPTRPPIQWLPDLFPGCKAAGAWSKPYTSIQCRG